MRARLRASGLMHQPTRREAHRMSPSAITPITLRRLSSEKDMRTIIHSDQAPKAIGPYSQAVRVGNTVYLSGQTPLDPATGEMVAGDISAQARRVFDNLQAVCKAADGSFDQMCAASESIWPIWPISLRSMR